MKIESGELLLKSLLKFVAFLFLLGSGLLAIFKLNEKNKQMIRKETTTFQVSQTIAAIASTLEKTKIEQQVITPMIKGNKNARGEQIYHVPGGAFYERTNPVEWFQTEEEAVAKGYRKSAR